MALSGGHSLSIADDESRVLAGKERVKAIPSSSLQVDRGTKDHEGQTGGPALVRSCRGLLRRVQYALPPLTRGCRERREQEKRADAVEHKVLGAPARGWPRDDIPGLYSSLSWLTAKVAVGGAAAAIAAPAGPVAASVVKVTTGLVGGRLGYKFGRRLDRVEVAHVHQYLHDVRDAAMAGMPAEACIEYAAMCDAGPFAPEDDICRWRPLWAGHGGGDWRAAVRQGPNNTTDSE